MANEPVSPELTECTVRITCTGADVKLHVTAPTATGDAAATASSHEFAPAGKKVGEDKLSMSGSFVGDPASMPSSIDQQLQSALDADENIPQQWHKVIQRYAAAQYAKIRMREQFRRVLEQRNAKAHDHIDTSAPTGPSAAGSRNTGAKTGHSGMTRRSGER